MPTEYPLGKARKATLQANRKAHQARARRRIITDLPRISMALKTSIDANGAWWDERTGSVYFGWHGRNINYSVTQLTLLVKHGKDTAVYTHYTPDQLISALRNTDPDEALRLFSVNSDYRKTV